MSGLDEQLTIGEIKLLLILRDLKDETLSKVLEDSLEWDEERVVSILQSLSQKGFVNLRLNKYLRFTLTPEGQDYLEKGLPEDRLLGTLEKMGGQATLDQIVSNSDLDNKTAGIAIGWAKRNGNILSKNEDGKTIFILSENAQPSNLHMYLKWVTERWIPVDDLESPQFKQIIDRKLVTEEKKDTKIMVKIEETKKAEINRLAHLPPDIDSNIINDLTPELLLSGEWRGKRFRPYNVEVEPVYSNYGKKHPYAEFNDWLREIMVGLGFTEWFGPYVETEFWGHDTLFVPQDHVAREVQDQFRVIEPYSHGHIFDKKYYKAIKEVHENGGDTGSTGWDWPYSEEIATRLCLRPHTTPVSMRYLYEHREAPQKMFIIDRNFRSETLSATHGQEFDQCEGIIMDKKLTLRDLMGYLTSICKGVGIEKLKFKPGQFPFTEPSVETFGKHDKLGWIELGGSGLFRPEVTMPLGIKDPVLAWGLGSGRLYMAAMGINDIRELLTRDLNWLRRSYFVR